MSDQKNEYRVLSKFHRHTGNSHFTIKVYEQGDSGPMIEVEVFGHMGTAVSSIRLNDIDADDLKTLSDQFKEASLAANPDRKSLFD